MKKTIAILIGLLVILSLLPAAFAYGSSGNIRVGIEPTRDSSDNETDVKVKSESNVRVEERREVKENREERLEDRKTALLRLRTNLLELKKDLRSCRDDRSKECIEVRTKVKIDSKDYMDKASERMLLLLEEAKTKVEESDLSADIKTRLNARIDADIKAVTDAKIKVEALNENSTSEEVKAAAKELREAWMHAKKTLRITNALVVETRVGLIVERADKLELRLNNLVAKLEAEGKDTTELKAKIDEFNHHIDTAREKRKEALNVLIEIKIEEDVNAEDRQEAVAKAHALLVEAKTHLKEAHQILKEIVIIVKEAKVNIETNTSVEVNTSINVSV